MKSDYYQKLDLQVGVLLIGNQVEAFSLGGLLNKEPGRLVTCWQNLISFPPLFTQFIFRMAG